MFGAAIIYIIIIIIIIIILLFSRVYANFNFSWNYY
jgi:hypothetical protein